MENSPAKVRLLTPQRDFVRPYVAAAWPDMELTDSPDDPTVVVCSPAEADELGRQYPGSALLVCAEIIGTGMTGFPLELARRVMRGTFLHVRGRDVPVSLIHAVDVGRAVGLVAGHSGVYHLADNAAHTVDELADALAHRMNDKRLLTLRIKSLEWLIAPAFNRLVAGLQAVDGSRFADRFGFIPVNVTEYLRTHVYDESSL